MPRINCLVCKREAHATLSETDWESFPGGWLHRRTRGLVEIVCSMKCADEYDRRLATSPYREPASVPIAQPSRPDYCRAYDGGLCCMCGKTHSSMTCCAHDEPVVPR